MRDLCVDGKLQQRPVLFDAECGETVLTHHFNCMLAPGLIPFGITVQVCRVSVNLKRDEPKHRRRHDLVRRPRTTGMPQEAKLCCSAEPVRVGPMRSHKLQVGGSECVKVLVLSQAGRERQNLNALGWVGDNRSCQGIANLL